MALTPRLPAGARIAAVASGAMIAQQVAGKATRDALFLSSFRVQDLPAMIAASALVSLFAALWLSRLMVRLSPARVVPAAFALSGAGMLAEWGISFVAPRVSAVALYLHTALFGAVLISAFWSLVNETFAPHSGRRAVSWIAGGGTIGGVVGGLVAWRAADQISLLSMLPVLASINLVCMWGTHRLPAAAAGAPGDPAGEDAAHADEPPEVPDGPDDSGRSLFRLVWGTPYLRNLGMIVALGAVTSGLLDYVFSAVAVQHFSKGPELLAFFAKFWLVVGVLSFLLQTLFGRIALEKLGLAFTLAVLPAVVVLGSALGLAVPGLLSIVLLRGGEATQRNSLFRAAYELLYTPLSARKKRATKTLIDVGCDRFGTALAGGIAMATVALVPSSRSGMVMLLIALACGLVSVARSMPIHRGYVALLEESLRRAAALMPPKGRATLDGGLREEIVEHLEAAATPARTPGRTIESIDEAMQAVLDLRSGDKARARLVLGAAEPLTAPLVAFTVLLLADKELHLDAIQALTRAAPTSTGQLVDSLCDPRVGFDTRRRIPRVLARCPTPAAAEGLVRGIEDERFEVRYACGRALLRIREANPEIAFGLAQIVAIVTREVARDAGVWSEDDDEDDDALPSLVDRLRRDRLDRSVEHVFNVLALGLDPDSLRTAFKALHQEEDALRGVALEYLETVLPDEVRDLVWPFLGEARPMRAARPATEILADLVRARHA
jgi:hypothetical protein